MYEKARSRKKENLSFFSLRSWAIVWKSVNGGSSLRGCTWADVGGQEIKEELKGTRAGRQKVEEDTGDSDIWHSLGANKKARTWTWLVGRRENGSFFFFVFFLPCLSLNFNFQCNLSPMKKIINKFLGHNSRDTPNPKKECQRCQRKKVGTVLL